MFCTSNKIHSFGSVLPGRKFNPGNYRYGFNGQEKDDEVKGGGNSYDFGARIYDSRLGRFLSMDQLAKKFPDLSPYQFASNTPIHSVDIDGLETPIPLDPATGRMMEFSEKEKAWALGGVFLPILAYEGMGVGLVTLVTRYPILKPMVENAIIGSTISGGISALKGESGYNIFKSAVSGFFGGAILAGGPQRIKDLSDAAKVIGIGSISGLISESVEQALDYAIGDISQFDPEKIATSGLAGGATNFLATSILGITKSLFKKIDAAKNTKLNQYNSQDYKDAVKKNLNGMYPRLSNKELNKMANDKIKADKADLEKAAIKAKTAIYESLDKALNVADEATKSKEDSN